MRGGLKARVTPQRAGDSLKIVTPHAEVGILGTELELFATPTQTEVGVVEGRARLGPPMEPLLKCLRLKS